MTEPVLYRWPAQAKFGRVVPKTKFYEQGKVTSAVRKRFVDEVQRITWAYKLADATIRLGGNAVVPEIQVFVIEAKDEDVPDSVLAAIDNSVPFPIIFEVSRNASSGLLTRMVAAHKQLSPRAVTLGPYLSSPWLADDTERRPLPAAIDLPSLYKELLTPLLPVATHPGERLEDATARTEHARKLEREIDKLERRLRTEPQFNRKVELRRRLLEHEEHLASITNPRTTADDALDKDTQWTS
jgi:hypothetical protein